MIDILSYDDHVTAAEDAAVGKLLLGFSLTEADARLLLAMQSPPPWVVSWQQSLGGQRWAVKIAWADLRDQISGSLPLRLQRLLRL